MIKTCTWWELLSVIAAVRCYGMFWALMILFYFILFYFSDFSFLFILKVDEEALSQTSFNLYLHNQWTDSHKPSCVRKPQMRTICTYVGCTKVTTNDWDIRTSVAIKALSANISWMAKQIHMIKLALGSAHQSVSNNIWYISKQ